MPLLELIYCTRKGHDFFIKWCDKIICRNKIKLLLPLNLSRIISNWHIAVIVFKTTPDKKYYAIESDIYFRALKGALRKNTSTIITPIMVYFSWTLGDLLATYPRITIIIINMTVFRNLLLKNRFIILINLVDENIDFN